jgi:peptidoglycan/LPS O-acetylase OafA/YrhL
MEDKIESPEARNDAAAARLYYLDWLRVLAILGVVIFHAVHVFDTIDWQIKNPEQSMLITVIILFFNFWGMHLFFLLSGAGSWFALQKRTPRRYAAERTQRLLVPFIFGALFLTPLMLYFTWQHQAPQLGGLEYVLFFLNDEVLKFGQDVVKIGFHLWFLGFLFAFSILALPIFLWLKKELGRKLVSCLAGIAKRRGGLLLFILPILAVRLILWPFFPIENSWADFTVYFCYFVIGYLFYADERFQKAVYRDWLLLLACGVVCFALMLLMLAAGDPFTWFTAPNLPQFYLLWGLITTHGWCWALFFLGLGMRKLDFTNSTLIYCQNAILPVFVVHQPVIIVIAYYVVQLNASITMKLPIVVFGSLAVSLGLYQFVIRRVRPLQVLFGMKTQTPEAQLAGTD